jgi:small conductance mechanosensitive channel
MLPQINLQGREIAVVDWPAIANTLLKVGVVLLVAWLAYRALGALTRRVERSISPESGTPTIPHDPRAATLVGLVRNVGIVVIALLSIFMVLAAIGLNVGPLLAGAGVVGLAISFGAQSLVKDIFAGLFILFENQFGVGDVVRLGDASGAVERMTLRATFLRDVSGTLHVVPNGEIKHVQNLTRSWSRAVLDIGVAYKEDVDRVIAVMREVGREMWEDQDWRPFLVEEAAVLGVESFGESSVNIRMMSKTLPLKQWEVARELRRRLKRRFDADGIEIPFPQRTVHRSDGHAPSPPAELQT